MNGFCVVGKFIHSTLRMEGIGTQRREEVCRGRSLEKFRTRVHAQSGLPHSEGPGWSHSGLWVLEPVQRPGLGVVSPCAAVSSWAKGFT